MKSRWASDHCGENTGLISLAACSRYSHQPQGSLRPAPLCPRTAPPHESLLSANEISLPGC